MRKTVGVSSGFAVAFLCVFTGTASGQGNAGTSIGTAVAEGKRLFEQETFGGNGRTCRTCHSKETGTVSPREAQLLFKTRPNDPLFVGDGSDDGNGYGTTRMQTDATILMRIPLASNVSLAADPDARFVTVRRGIPTTLNTPALDPVLMLDGRQPDLQSQANGAIHDHAQATITPSAADLDRIKAFQLTNEFFSSAEVRKFAHDGLAPGLPPGNTASEKRGRRFFEDMFPTDQEPKLGLCAGCHAGPMLNETNDFSEVVLGIPKHTRFQNILVSLFNVAENPVQEFVFNRGTPDERRVFSPDIGVSAITGVSDKPEDDPTFTHFEAFKIPQLRGIRDTGPYFHDNSAKTLEDVIVHYARFFDLVTGGFITLTPQDQADIVAFMKLLR